MTEADGVAVDDLVIPETKEPAPQLEDSNTPAPKQIPHPLEPEGKRFEQVYARWKQADRDIADLRAKNEALEARLNTPKKEEEYTPAQLEAFIAENRITRADATAYREDLLLKKAVNTAKNELREETTSTDRVTRLTSGIAEYIQLVPSITEKTSEDRARLDAEFDFVASVQGISDTSKLKPADRKALELIALRNVFGTIEQVKKRTNVSTTPETQQELGGGNPPRKEKSAGQVALDKLTTRQVEHYKKMMAAGRYAGGWKEVAAELTFDPNNREVKKK